MELIYFYLVAVLLSPTTLGYDIQIQGNIHVGDDMVEKIWSLFRGEYNIRIPKREIVNTTEGINEIGVNNTSQKNFTKQIHGVDVKRTKKKSVTKVGGTTKTDGMAKELEDLILKKQIENLRNIGFIIHEHLNLNVYTVSLTLFEITDKHKRDYKKFFAFVYSLNTRHVIEKEYLYLNIIDTTNRMLSVNARKMLHRIAKDNHKYETLVITKIHQQINRIINKEKRENLNYICSKLSICKTYPAYSHCLVEFLHIILNLSTSKLDTAVIVFENLFDSNEETFSPIIDNKVKDNLKSGCKSSNVDTVTNFLTGLRSDIELSYNIFDKVTKTAVFRKKCLRILLDIIDKMIEKYYEVVSAAFEKVKKAIKEWDDGTRNDFDVFFKEFLEDVVIVPIKYYLTPLSKEEIFVLLNVMSTGNALRLIEYNYLFTNGSKFVKKESASDDLD